MRVFLGRVVFGPSCPDSELYLLSPFAPLMCSGCSNVSVTMPMCAAGWTGLGFSGNQSECSKCPKRTNMFPRVLYIRYSLFLPLFTIINTIHGDLDMLHGLELLIPSSGTRAGKWDTRRKLAA